MTKRDSGSLETFLGSSIDFRHMVNGNAGGHSVFLLLHGDKVDSVTEVA